MRLARSLPIRRMSAPRMWVFGVQRVTRVWFNVKQKSTVWPPVDNVIRFRVIHPARRMVNPLMRLRLSLLHDVHMSHHRRAIIGNLSPRSAALADVMVHCSQATTSAVAVAPRWPSPGI